MVDNTLMVMVMVIQKHTMEKEKEMFVCTKSNEKSIARSHSIDFMNIVRWSQNNVKRGSSSTQNNNKIYERLIILSEFNQTEIHRSICECYILLIIFECILRKHIMRNIKKTDSRIVISENTQSEVLETFIIMKSDTECNETTPAIIFHIFHEYYKIFTKWQIHCVFGFKATMVEISRLTLYVARSSRDVCCNDSEIFSLFPNKCSA